MRLKGSLPKMIRRIFLPAVATLLLAGLPCPGGAQDQSQAESSQTDTPPTESNAPAEDSISYWVEQLDHDLYLRREMASKKLTDEGPAAIDALVAVIGTAELEIVERAMGVIREIALSRPPREDGGAWDQLNVLADKGAGRRASCAQAAVDEVREYRAGQARKALKDAGVFVGLDEFAIRAISQPRMIVQIDDGWRGDIESLQWLRWLRGVENARVKGAAVRRDVLDRVTKIPGLKSLAIVDGKLDDATLEPLMKMDRIHSLEFRYVELTEYQAEQVASLPIRVSLNLMGTGIPLAKVESMRSSLPGLQIDHRQGGFLGVTCLDSTSACAINGVLPNSAAEEAGLIKGDVIVRVGDTEVTRFKDLQNAINQHPPGDEIEVKYRRGDKIESVKLHLRRFEES